MEFVDNWFITATLGEGAFGEVKLLHHRKSGESVALKILKLLGSEETEAMIKKEISIHKQLKHENVIKFLGARMDANIWYIFLEYADAGELYDRIDPDVGVSPRSKAAPYFRQLISGVLYLHGRGIVHRDLKPENILLTKSEVVKITDFGFATLYRNEEGKERLLDLKCGTPPYVAPEVFSKPNYKAMPVDVWSAGIVLCAMLAGELPWDRADVSSSEYLNWKEGVPQKAPWNKFDLQTLSFFKKLLCPTPSKRISLEHILSHSWMSPTQGRKRKASSEFCSKKVDSDLERLMLCCMSQPDPLQEEVSSVCGDAGVLSFSQPACLSADQFFLSNSNENSFGAKSEENLVNKLVKRMTRFFVNRNSKDTVAELVRVLDEFGYTWKVSEEHRLVTVVTISTVDRRKNALVFKGTVIEMYLNKESWILLDFRLSRGDGLEFKRHFLRLRDCLKHIHLLTGAPLQWLLQ